MLLSTGLTTVLLLTGCTGTSSSSGSCALNEVVLGSSDLRPGGSVQLSVDWLYRTCEDTGGTFRPSEDVTVTITPASTGRSVLLGRPSPEGPTLRVAGRFALPADLPRGDAVLGVHSHDGDGSGADLPVTIG